MSTNITFENPNLISRRGFVKAAAVLFAGAAVGALSGCDAQSLADMANGASSGADANAFFVLSKITRGNCEYTFTNDSVGNCTSLNVYEYGTSYTKNYVWDANGNLLSYKTYDESGKVTGWNEFSVTATDDAGRATTVKRGSSNVVTLAYDSNGYVASSSRGKYTDTFSDGAATKLWYSQTSGNCHTIGNFEKDANGHITSFVLDDGANTPRTYVLEYAADGSISSLQDADDVESVYYFEWEKVENPSAAVASKPPIFYVTWLNYCGPAYILEEVYDV